MLACGCQNIVKYQSVENELSIGTEWIYVEEFELNRIGSDCLQNSDRVKLTFGINDSSNTDINTCLEMILLYSTKDQKFIAIQQKISILLKDPSTRIEIECDFENKPYKTKLFIFNFQNQIAYTASVNF